MFKNLLNKLTRITSRGDFIPQIDGLRFLAIMSVLFLHSHTFITVKNPVPYLDNMADYSWLTAIFKNGGSGVYLFFAISGFILSLPFANYYLNGGKKISLKSYYLRRVTRIEPPYIISMIVLFIANIYVVGKYSFEYLFPRLLASLGYVHNFVYHGWSRVNGVAWSLEIEVQFYILAPLLASVFIIKNRFARRGLLFFLIILIPILNHLFPVSDLSLYTFLHFFLVGFILADLYATKDKLKINQAVLSILGFFFLYAILIIRPDLSLGHSLGYTISVFAFYYTVLNTAFWSKLFSYKIITVIGGMCYTIYLYHYQIISYFGNRLIHLRVTDYFLPNFFFQLILLFTVVLIVSGVFFAFLERPFMRRDWPALFIAWAKNKLAANGLKINTPVSQREK